MKLITPELANRFDEVGDQSETDNPTFIAKFFDPAGSASWYATEYCKETNICRGYVTGLYEDEWGSFSISELESIKRPFGLKIERDLYFKETTYHDLFPEKKRLNELSKAKEQNNEKGRERG